MIAEGFACVGGLCGEFYRIPTQAQRDDVGEIMRGVGEQGEAVAENPRDNFTNDKYGC